MALGIKYPAHASVSRRVVLLIALFSLILLTVVACGPKAPTPAKEAEVTISLSSAAFKERDQIPVKYTCDGQDISPPLAWGEPPQGTQAFALIVDDIDAPAGVFTHWVIFNIPSDSHKLEEAIATQVQLPGGALQGKNDSREISYAGPCPPGGCAHRYQFTLYALDQPVDLKAGVTKKQLLTAIQEHILAQGQLTGTYQP